MPTKKRCASLCKFRSWVDDLGSQTVAATVLECSVPHVNLILSGRRKPSRALAGRIATCSRRWKHGPVHGPIEMSGWDQA